MQTVCNYDQNHISSAYLRAQWRSMEVFEQTPGVLIVTKLLFAYHTRWSHPDETYLFLFKYVWRF